MADHPAKTESRAPSPWLRRADQAAIGAVALIAIAAIGGYWLVQGGASGRLIEIERAPRQTVSFQLDVNEADWPGRTSL